MTNLVNSTSLLLAMLNPPHFAEISAIVPGAILCLAALLVVVLDVFHINDTSRSYLSYVTAFAFVICGFSCYFLWDHIATAPAFFGMLYLDRFGLFFTGVISVAGFLAALFSPAYLRLTNMDRGEFYILTLFSASGMVFMVSAADLLTIFISLEVMSIPLYCIAAFSRQDRRSAEAGLKYFILGAFSTALTLYGVALIYGVTGTTNLEAVSLIIRNLFAGKTLAFTASNSILVLGSFLTLAGFIFKIAAAPFHIWAPDVYTGTPTPASGFMATGVKAASFAVILRLILTAFNVPELTGGFYGIGWLDALFVFSACSVVIGNFVAIAQTNVKRMLAYSSIAHAGYILVGVCAANSKPDFFIFNDSVLYYLVAYTFTTLGAFGVLTHLGKTSGRPVETYEDIQGVGLTYPAVGIVMSIFMLSSAGIPPTAGFLGKFYIFRAAVDVAGTTHEMNFIVLAVLAVLCSVCGVYYYLKVLVSMYMFKKSDDVVVVGTTGSSTALTICAAAVLVFGIFPQPLIDLSQDALIHMNGPSHVQQPRNKAASELQHRRQVEEHQRPKVISLPNDSYFGEGMHAENLNPQGANKNTANPINIDEEELRKALLEATRTRNGN